MKLGTWLGIGVVGGAVFLCAPSPYPMMADRGGGDRDQQDAPPALPAVEPGWNLRGNDIVWTKDRVGIGIKNPTDALDVKGDVRCRSDLRADGEITLAPLGNNDAMVILNRFTYDGGTSYPAQFLTGADTGSYGGPFIIASGENDDSNETSGVYGAGDVVTIWSSGDGAAGLSGTVFVLDEDAWDDDADAYNDGAIVAYLNDDGLWIASDINRKQNIEPLLAATDALMQIGGYTYEYTLSPQEVAKGQQPRRVAGLIAQEVIEVLPDAVQISDSGEHFINLTSITPLLVEALKEQVIRNQQNEARIESLEARLAELEAAARLR